MSCRDDAYVFNDSCLSCKPGWAPNENKTDCYKLKAEVIPWYSPWAIVPLVFSTIGILMTLFTFCIFIKYNNTPIIMASGRELCYVSSFRLIIFPGTFPSPSPYSLTFSCFFVAFFKEKKLSSKIQRVQYLTEPTS